MLIASCTRRTCGPWLASAWSTTFCISARPAPRDCTSGRTVIGSADHEPMLVVPAHTQIEFSARATDVIHSFWIPSERFKRDAFPDRTTRFDLVFEHVGETVGHCAEFCGLRHADMNFNVRVLSPADFRAWAGGKG